MQLTAFAAWLNSAFGGYDRFFLRLAHSLSESLGSVLTPVMKFITLLGEKGLILILISLVLMLFSRTRKTGVCMFGAIACGAILTNFILKDWVARPRPFESLRVYREWWEALGSPAEDGFSFPSGHVTAAVAGLTGLCLTRGRKWILPTVIWVLLMGLSRNYLMAHFPSDVLFAVLIGLIAAVVAYAITQLIFRLLEAHADNRFCAGVLDYDIRQSLSGLSLSSLRLPSLRRNRAEEETGEPVDPERVDVSDAFDEIVRESRSGGHLAEEPAVEEEARPGLAALFSRFGRRKAEPAEETGEAIEEPAAEEPAAEEAAAEEPAARARFAAMLSRFSRREAEEAGEAGEESAADEPAAEEKAERPRIAVRLPGIGRSSGGYQGKHVK